MYYADMLYFVALFGGLVVGALVILAVVLLLVWVHRILATLKDIRQLLVESQINQAAEHRQE
ncbi:hypothetical protein [Schleiferilactobacillus harbinensis]|jgi:hypothetical protein|uniref:hypothetical protein n=1 Tax=Schleiferilactobacillus harbinensis TaxID=304207 RepID=UPI0024325DF9|nr:hypothetical protein [Schleiferilactobacillus harbinensis]MCI1850348.1 hypothetical protein [Schleiferilactobacillus harbinensis]